MTYCPHRSTVSPRMAGWFLLCLGLVTLGCGTPKATSPESAPQGALSEDNPSAAPIEPPAEPGFGTIVGQVIWDAPTPPAPRILIAKGAANITDGEVCAANDLYAREDTVDPMTKGVAHIYAYLVHVRGENSERLKSLLAQDAVVDQKSCEFLPFAMAMHYKQKLVLKNSDPIRHITAILAPSSPNISPSIPPNSATTFQLFQAERSPAAVSCPMHPWMDGWVFALDHPFFAVTSPDGRFRLEGVPAGAQFLAIRHPVRGFLNPEKAKGISVRVPANGIVDVGTIPLNPERHQVRATSNPGPSVSPAPSSHPDAT